MGVERKAEEVRLQPPGCPLPLQLARGNSPPANPQPGLRRRRGRGRRLRSAAVFHFTFADPGGDGERPLRCPVWLQRTRLRAQCPLCPGGWAGGRASQSVRKQAERSEPTPQLGDGRSSGPWQPRPCAPSSLRGAGELELALVTTAASPVRHRFSPGCSHSGWKVHPSSGFSKHTFVSTHPHGSAHTRPSSAHAPPSPLQTLILGRLAAEGSCERAQCALRPAPRRAPGCGEPRRSGRTPRSQQSWRRRNAPSPRE